MLTAVRASTYTHIHSQHEGEMTLKQRSQWPLKVLNGSKDHVFMEKRNDSGFPVRMNMHQSIDFHNNCPSNNQFSVTVILHRVTDNLEPFPGDSGQSGEQGRAQGGA